jgi:hypothetical protein
VSRKDGQSRSVVAGSKPISALSITQRWVGAANVVGDLLRKGSLRDELAERAAADILWVLNDPGLYHQLVGRQGWAPETFAEWLAETMQRLLLADQLPNSKLTG